MFWRSSNAVAKSSDEDWPGLGTWFHSSEDCPECRPYLAEQQKTIAAAERARAQRAITPRVEPPGLGTWYPNSEECPECQPYLEEQAKTLERARSRPTAPARAIEKARARSAEMMPYLDEPIPDMGRFDWDLPEDHEMSASGKIAWNVAIYGTMLAIPVVLFLTSPFSTKDTARHYVAAAGCPFAKLVDLSPAREGNPGYHAHLDNDGDGIACEVDRARTLTTGGRHFIKNSN